MSCETPVRISATGPDGAGKDTAWRFAKPHLPEQLRILKIGKPTSLVVNGNECFVDITTSHFLDSIHGWADRKRSRLLISLTNCAYVLFQWRIQEPLWISKFHPDIIFSLRDDYTDPAAYAPFYMPETLGKLPIPQRIDRLYQILHSPLRHHTVFLDIDPNLAVRRIDERFENERTTQVLIQPKRVHMHENVAVLTAIRCEFFSVLDYLKTYRKVEVGYVDASLPKKQVGEKLATYILQNIRS